MNNRRDVTKLPGLISGIKIEPGNLGASPGRLPSFGVRRDLTLGSSGPSKINRNSDSKAKRVYTPNLNVQRNKNKVELSVKEEHPNSKDKFRDRRNDGRDRRKDRSNNLIQSTGVFAEGIAEGKKNRRYGGGGGGDRNSNDNIIQKPKLNLKHDKKIDKEEEEMKLKQLLKDDFIDDPSTEPDTSNAPLRLPMLDKIKIELKTEHKPKKKQDTLFGGVMIKQELVEDVIQDIKPKLKPNGEIETEKEPSMTKMKSPDQITIEDVFQDPDPQLIFLQLPDCLPGLNPETETGPARPSTTAKPSTSVPPQTNETQQISEPTKHCTLNNLSEGHIGKLQLLESGKARLILGNNILYIDVGTQIGFRQDLISVDLDHTTRGGDMINLGSVNTRLVCSPDWETMLKRAVI